MISAILALFTSASFIGTEPPQLVAHFKSVEDCLISASKLNIEQREQLIEAGAGFICLVLKAPTI